MTRIAILGVTGRMGRALLQALQEQPELQLCGAMASVNNPNRGRDVGELAGLPPLGVKVTGDRAIALARAELAIDFSLPEATASNMAACARRNIPIVIGTTGHGEHWQINLKAVAEIIPVLAAPNMSVGVSVMARLIEAAARALAEDYDIEILEQHHRHKIDAPSGTALRLGEVVAKARGVDLAQAAVFDRHGRTGPRERGKIGFAVLRAGDAIGEHTVQFSGDGETLSVTHRATDRLSFARGALRAALWLRGQPAGLYSMESIF